MKIININGKDIEFDENELNDTLGITLCCINTLGEKYWTETKKVFDISDKLREKIDSVFNNKIS